MISLILPIRNEANFIRQSLDAILAQDTPMDEIEILVADGMSTDGTREIVAEYQKNHPNLFLIDNPGKIVPTAMNLALQHARGEVIIRVDGHCIIAPDYLSKCVNHLQSGEFAGVGGPMTSIGETPFSETIALAMSSSFGVGNSAFRTTSGRTMVVDTVPFPAYTRKIINEVGLYDEELVRNQDDEYNYRIREHGGRLLLAEDIHSKYYSRGSLSKLWKQYYQYGFYKVRVLQKHPHQMSLRQFIPPTFVFSLIGSLLLAIFTPWGKWLLLPVLGSYLLANVAASFYTASKKGWRHLLVLPAAFAIIHISYGLGFLSGLVKFWNRWGESERYRKKRDDNIL